MAVDETEIRRLHPISILFSLGSVARGFFIPAVVLLFASRGRGAEVWMLLLIVPTTIGAMLRYWSYRYRLGEEDLMIREGIITRNERHIPYGRIQNIDLVQNPFHRMFRVAEVRIETAGGDKPEAVIRVLSLAAVDRMRTRVFADRERARPGEPERAQEPATVVYHAKPRDVFWFGVVSNRGMVVVAAVLGMLSQLDPVETWIEPKIRENWGAVEGVPALGVSKIVLFVVVALAVFWILLRVLSVVWAFVTIHDFRLTRRGDDLRAEYGLLTRVSKTIPRHRVQLLSVRESVMHRLLGRVSVQVETAGGAEGGASSGKLWLAPIVQKNAADAIVNEALPGIELGRANWQPLAAGARGRWFRRWLIVIVPAVSVLAVVWTPWILVSVAALVPLAWLESGLRARHTGWAVVGDAVCFRSGWWSRRTSLTRIGKIQALDLGATPFDRRAGMASLRVDTAGAGRVGHRIDVPFLDAAVAAKLLDGMAVDAGRTAFKW